MKASALSIFVLGFMKVVLFSGKQVIVFIAQSGTSKLTIYGMYTVL